MRVLVCTARRDLSRSVESSLATRWASTRVTSASDWSGILDSARNERFDLIVCDHALLSRGAWHSVIASLREEGGSVPIMVLGTDTTTIADEIVALDAGADEWVVLPVLGTQFIVRVETLLRRRNTHALTDQSGHGSLGFDPENRLVSGPKGMVPLSALETGILALLLESANRYVSNAELCEKAWGPGAKCAPARVKVGIHRLRNKLSKAGASPSFIECGRGLGYKITETSQ